MAEAASFRERMGYPRLISSLLSSPTNLPSDVVIGQFEKS
jgi:hypothetical protein